jgi:hypothetical protein
MKVLVEDYTFDKTLKTITFNSYPSIDIENILLITNISFYSYQIYNFADSSATGTVLGNVLTLTVDTSLMSSTDKLQIWYENGLTPSSNEVLDALYEVAARIDFLAAVRGVSADLRVTPLSTPNMSALTTLSNLAGLSGWGTGPLVKDFDNLTAINSNINNVAP